MSPTRREPVSGQVPMTGQWALRAACRGKPTNWWYPDAGIAKAAAGWARDICRDCPVSRPCRDHAMRYSEMGIWAGLSDADRIRLRQGRRQLGGPAGKAALAFLEAFKAGR